MTTESTTTVRSTDAARQARRVPLECPACLAAQEAVEALMGQIGDAATAPDGLNWLGICNTHAWQLAAREQAARRVIADHLRAALQRLADSGGVSRREPFGRKRYAASTGASGGCPFCDAMAASARVVLERPIGAAGGEHASLCVPHLCDALASVHGADRVRALARDAGAHFSELEQDLSELIRKSDYRFRGELRGREATSWSRTAKLVAGAAGVRWSLRREPEIEG